MYDKLRLAKEIQLNMWSPWQADIPKGGVTIRTRWVARADCHETHRSG